MTVRVKLFAVARQWVGQDEVELELPPAAVVSDLRRTLVERFPALAPLADQLMFAVDMQYAGDDVPLSAEAEVAVIPPVSGG